LETQPHFELPALPAGFPPARAVTSATEHILSLSVPPLRPHFNACPTYPTVPNTMSEEQRGYAKLVGPAFAHVITDHPLVLGRQSAQNAGRARFVAISDAQNISRNHAGALHCAWSFVSSLLACSCSSEYYFSPFFVSSAVLTLVFFLLFLCARVPLLWNLQRFSGTRLNWYALIAIIRIVCNSLFLPAQ
jgi:hypothetical protein